MVGKFLSWWSTRGVIKLVVIADCSTFDYSCDGSGEFCYDESDKCDGECDCLSRESYCLDEADCPGQCNLQTQFTCPSTNICIPKSFVSNFF